MGRGHRNTFVRFECCAAPVCPCDLLPSPKIEEEECRTYYRTANSPSPAAPAVRKKHSLGPLCVSAHAPLFSQVILCFSALGTERFQGYGIMKSDPNPDLQAPWKCSKRIAQCLGDCFEVEWQAKCSFRSEQTNPWNGGKALWNSRDCQEIAPEVGQELCEMLEKAGS